MDQKTFDFLQSLYNQPPIPYINLDLRQETVPLYKHLLANNYIEKEPVNNIDTVSVTIEGCEYVENRLLKESLIELQRQNFSLQVSLKKCQYWLIAATFLSALGAIISVWK